LAEPLPPHHHGLSETREGNQVETQKGCGRKPDRFACGLHPSLPVNFKLSPVGKVDFGFAVQSFMAVSAQGDEVQIVVVALLAPQFLVVDM
jgi:hypothetical protein